MGGDTLVVNTQSSSAKGSSKKRKKKTDSSSTPPCLAGVASPKPVLKVRLEAETTKEQAQLSEALRLLTIEDPSLHVEETDHSTLLSGLGELHIEVTLDRIAREHNLTVVQGAPSVAYRESIIES